VVFPPHAREKAERIVESFPQRRTHVAHWLGIEATGPAMLHLVDDLAGMRALGGEGVPEWAVAITRFDGVMVYRLDKVDHAPTESLDIVLRHETVHHVLRRLRHGPRAVYLPRWFEEGLCVHHAGVPYVQLDTSLERMAAAGKLPPFDEVDRLFRSNQRGAAVAYRLGHVAVTEFLRRFGDDALRALLRRLEEGRSFEHAFYDATGTRLPEFERSWRESITPRVPFVVFVLLENIELTLLCFGALLVFFGYVRWRLRRPRELEELEG